MKYKFNKFKLKIPNNKMNKQKSNFNINNFSILQEKRIKSLLKKLAIINKFSHLKILQFKQLSNVFLILKILFKKR